jgi:hypothetical protein
MNGTPIETGAGMPHRSAVMGLLLFAAGCGTSVTATALNGGPDLVPRPTRRVQVFASGPPHRPYRDVALLEVEQTHSLNEQGTALMIERLRERAAQLGCDGVVFGGFTERDGAQPGSGWDLIDPGATTLRATCIVFRDAPMVRTAASVSRPATLDGNPQRSDWEEPR